MKQIKLISTLIIGVFVLSTFISVASVNAIDAGSSTPSTNSRVNVQKTPISIDGLLVQLRKDKSEFETNKLAEETAQADSVKEKVTAKRKAALAKVEAAKKIKDEKRKVVLTRLIDIQIKQLGNVKERVAKMPNIKADLKTNLNLKIDEALNELEAEKTVLAAITTPEDLKKFAKELKDSFKSKRDIVKQIVDAILSSRADNTITAAEGRLADITAKITVMKTAGQNTSALDALLAAAQSKISSADTKIGKEDLKGAVSDLKEAYKNMKSVVDKIDSIK